MPPKLVRRRNRPSRIARLLVLLLAVVGAITACGSDPVVPGQQGRTPTQLLADAAKALVEAKSYHVSSDTLDGVIRTTYDLDVIGASASGTFSQDGVWTLHIVWIGDTIYAEGKSYWVAELGDAQAKQIGDRCMRVTPFSSGAKKSIKQFTRFADTAGYAQGLQTPNGTASIDGSTTFQGRSAISISDGDSKVYIDQGKPSYPLHIEKQFGQGQGYTNFSRFNEVTKALEAPTGCLDLAQMSGVFPSASPTATPEVTASGPAPTLPPLVTAATPTP